MTDEDVRHSRRRRTLAQSVDRADDGAGVSNVCNDGNGAMPLRMRNLSGLFLIICLAGCGDDAGETGATHNPEAPSAPDRVAREPDDAVLLSREQYEAGWVSLFDGRTLFGWKPNNDVNWSVVDGVITADQGEPGLLLTTTNFADYELRFDYRLETDGNSGVFLRTPMKPTNPATDCYEFNMCDSHKEYKTGSLVGRAKPLSIVNGEGAWKQVHITVDGPKISATIDGESVLKFIDDGEDALTDGFIGLQKNAGKIEFKNVALRPLGMKPIFNGKSLEGWNVVPGSQAEFKVAGGSIRVLGGPGFLETDKDWADFVLQFDVRTNDVDINSGVFFRAMKGTDEAPSNGYEFQIHNGFSDGDRTKPNDYQTGFGTGAIFRRRKVRRVVSNDEEWCTLTLVARGPHFTTWVNGYPVVDWTDDREPDENPRKGQRLDAGRLSLQGHDLDTDVDFRNLRIAPR